MEGMWNMIGVPEPYGGFGYDLIGFGVSRMLLAEGVERPVVDEPEPDCCCRCDDC